VGAPMEYVPILRGRQGELIALSETSMAIRRQIRPVLEVVLEGSVRGTVQRFFRQASHYLPAGLPVTLDCTSVVDLGPVGTGFQGHAMGWLGEGFEQFHQRIVPVFRPGDPEIALTEVRDVHHRHHQGACLRLGLDSIPVGRLQFHRQVATALDAVGLGPQHVDLLLDVGYLPNGHALAQTLPRLLRLLAWAYTVPWRRVTVAAGSFPQRIPAFEPYRPQRLHRWEVDLWHQLARHTGHAPPAFADYGVTHPVHPHGRRWGKANLRYTVDDNWQVLTGKTDKNHESYTLCEHLVASDHWIPGNPPTPWGDRQIALRARNNEAGPGGGREWRAWATSHHLATVTHRIQTQGGP